MRVECARSCRAARAGHRAAAASGARPIPPVTIMTSRPSASSTGQPRPIGPRTASVSPRSSAQIVAVAAPAALIVSSKPSGWKRDTEIGGAATAGRPHITNWPGLPASRRASSVVSLSVITSGVSRRLSTTLAIVHGSSLCTSVEGCGASVCDLNKRRHRLDGSSSCEAVGGAMAISSSRTSMPTGHQVMQRPQPTQPLLPNWSHHVANLWVSHWR